MNPVLLAGLVVGLAFLLTAFLTPAVRSAALAGGMVREAQSDRWHTRPTPAVGGIAIFFGFGLAVGVAYLLAPDTVRGLAVRSDEALLPWSAGQTLLAASTLAFLVGVLDDLVDLRPAAKLLGQLAATGLLLAGGIGVWLTGWYAADVAISVVWFIGITNALNLLDNMDGLASGIAAIAGGYLCLIFLLEGATGLAILAGAFTAALLGFLAHNYPPARIFMGDSGSLFLGLFLAGLALAPAPGLSRSLAAVLAAPVLILGVPILDTTVVTIGRLLEGRPVSQGGRDHTSHRLVSLGVPERRTLWLLWGLAATGGAVGLLLRAAGRGTAVLLGGVLVGALTLVGAYFLVVRFRALEEEGDQGLSLYRFFVRGQERYPIFAVILDGIWFGLAYYGAYLIRWEAAELPAELPYFERTVALWVGLKMVGFVLTGAYASRWPTFGLHDGMRLLRSNLVGTLLAVGVILLVDRVGLSRGVIAIDLLVCGVLTIGSRLSFRLMEGTAKIWSETGEPVVFLGPAEDVGLVERSLGRLRGPRFRLVAAADPVSAATQARLGAVRLFGGGRALGLALEQSTANTVVLLDNGGDRSEYRAALAAHLDRSGGVDVWLLEVGLRRMDGP